MDEESNRSQRNEVVCDQFAWHLTDLKQNLWKLPHFATCNEIFNNKVLRKPY